MKPLPPFIAFVILLVPSVAVSQQDGEQNFKAFCSACHTIAKGKLVGPDLLDVHKRRTDAWLVDFIKFSQAMIKSGDETAVALFKEYNQSVMPDPPFSVDQIKSIITYIKSQSPGYVAESGITKE